jgi:reductive dehalogenase
MFVHAASKQRPYHLGPFPLETLPRDPAVAEWEAARAPIAPPQTSAASGPLAAALRHYYALYAPLAAGEPAKQQAPLPDDLARRAADVKGCAYFMNASQVGICAVPDNAWNLSVAKDSHSRAVVMLVEFGRVPERDSLAHEWVGPAVREAAELRAAEIAVCLARHIRAMGFAARADLPREARLDHTRLAVLAGLALRKGECIVNPFVGEHFALAVVTTEYELALDQPLHESARIDRFRYWLGINGAMSGRERQRRTRRVSHLSRFPMETVKRVARPTTLILDDEVPRVPKRAAFFERALQGDLGDKAKIERSRFSFKHPVSWAQLGLVRALVPHQDGPVAVPGNADHTVAAVGDSADLRAGRYHDAAANTRAIKSLSYFLGSDLTGICEIPNYAWYSHKSDGTPIEPYHRYAVVMLVDQEFATMEGASGDDWISGAQSMRAYLRGAEIAGVMAEMLRALGFPARPQTNADSDVLHIPLVLWAGLGELSRIGELVLNPFVGPRFKSVVLTTDLPLVVDQPIDFGLQEFCSGCLKCARECPCDAIPFGGKVMFNGYEIWKPDVERCTRYRLTNAKGSACGRCMKTCPINKVVDADGALLTRVGSWLGINARPLKSLLVPIATWLDDRLGNGKRNPAKKWWFDHEIVNGVAVTPKSTNERDIEPARRVDAAKQKIAYYHASMMPPPDAAHAVPVDRKAALAAAAWLETPAAAVARNVHSGGLPAHYSPTAPAGSASRGGERGRVKGPYEPAEGAR